MTIRIWILFFISTAFVGGCGDGDGREVYSDAVREFRPYIGDRWVGNAVSYGPHRDGQYPGGPSPSREQIREDLAIMLNHWNLLRTYSAIGPAERLLEIIREDRLDMKVMLGVWIGVEERRGENGAVVESFPAVREANRREVEVGIRLANQYPDIVIAVCVGNETQVEWSAHRSPLDLLIGYVRTVRDGTKVPVSTADDYNFWNKPESHTLAPELDFIVLHAHPMWNGVLADDALEWTRDTYRAIQAQHPNHLVVYGETGWATMKHDEGEQARLIKGRPGEEEQAAFYDAVTSWAKDERVTVFFFEAFDENWKGGEHADEVEKHWGLYRADRTPKLAVQRSKPIGQ
jgi:exo-beta-1,3-glucanase (GH17 family)